MVFYLLLIAVTLAKRSIFQTVVAIVDKFTLRLDRVQDFLRLAGDYKK
jgi:hypothetical protein